MRSFGIEREQRGADQAVEHRAGYGSGDRRCRLPRGSENDSQQSFFIET
jgi:hypothetical protein